MRFRIPKVLESLGCLFCESFSRYEANTSAQTSNANPQLQAALQARAQQGQAAQLLSGQTPQAPQNTQQLGATHPLANVNRLNAANQLVVNGQPRPRMPMQQAPTSNASMGDSGASGGGFSFYFEQPWYQKQAISTYLNDYVSTDVKQTITSNGYANFSNRGIPDISAHSLYPE